MPDVTFIAYRSQRGHRDAEDRKIAHTHAMNVAAKRDRAKATNKMEHFKVTTSAEMARRQKKGCELRRRLPSLVGPAVSPGSHRIDPFETLAFASVRTDSLLRSPAFKEAAEPLFTVDNTRSYHDLHSVFPWSITDPGFFSALMFCTIVVETRGRITAEALTFKDDALRRLNKAISAAETATSSSCIGTIMVLTGAEYRLGNRQAHETHMAGLVQIIKLCNSGLNEGIRRGLFWQDLIGAVMSGSKRFFTHDSFEEIRWSRASGTLAPFMLPPGFIANSDVLTEELTVVLEDLQALKTSLGSPDCKLSAFEIHRVQASIESRLFFLQPYAEAAGYITECCRLATYICSYCVFTDLWDGSLIPHKLAKCLGKLLLEVYEDSCWASHIDLLLWMLFIGAISADAEYRQTAYIKMIQETVCHVKMLFPDWADMKALLEDFIWFENVFQHRCRYVWVAVKGVGDIK